MVKGLDKKMEKCHDFQKQAVIKWINEREMQIYF